jgi:hypothetical protein
MENHAEIRGGVGLDFRTSGLENTFRGLFWQVLERFRPLPPYRVLCYCDIGSLWWCSSSRRGVFLTDLERRQAKGEFPSHLKDRIYDADGRILDALIHIPGSTCCAKEPVLYVVALAHELQHFVQWAGAPTMFEPKSKLMDKLREGGPDATDWDIPAERDATIVSKRVAYEVCGRDAVAEFVEAEIAKGDDKPYWEFFRAAPLDRPYDWAEETAKLLARATSD